MIPGKFISIYMFIGLDNKIKSEFTYLLVLTYAFGSSKEPSHLDGSFEYPQHMFWMRNKKTIF